VCAAWVLLPATCCLLPAASNKLNQQNKTKEPNLGACFLLPATCCLLPAASGKQQAATKERNKRMVNLQLPKQTKQINKPNLLDY